MSASRIAARMHWQRSRQNSSASKSNSLMKGMLGFEETR
jgi:hypothetical protein